MDIKIVDPSGNEVIKEPQLQESERNISAPVAAEIERGAIADILDLDRKMLARYDGEIGSLLEYAKSQTDDHSIENLKWVIRSLELKLGTPPLAEKRITFLSRYAYLLKEEANIKKEKEQFERKPLN